MTQATAETEVRWTVVHRAYAILVGAGVFLVLVSMLAFPAPLVLGLLLLPAAVAVFLGQLSLFRTRDMRGLWVGHGLVSLASVTVAVFPVVVLAAMGGNLTDAFPPPRASPVGWALFAAVVSGLAGWLACHLERFADRGSGLPLIGRSPWNPRRWGPAGVLGVALFLVTIQGWGWLFTWPLEWRGSTPWGMAVFFAGVWTVVGAACLVVGLAIEGALGLRRSRRTA